jgi:hypothetical protein
VTAGSIVEPAQRSPNVEQGLWANVAFKRWLYGFENPDRQLILLPQTMVNLKLRDAVA